ncbi:MULTISPECIES: TPM domain-containing protein [Heyndrickxia]|uniref:TPM domain-containing protein n=1 Tax=Heyndrickxia TaxID=2837504 RepID=UPI0003AA5CB0|nr:TPM domain-containing protein [Heyndrickxia oleronia]NYV67380.1 TPM domain-containing protein [Bacillus sp. Gen3]MCI1591518.1 TPM domain-containing protein [Heyndrickxia oleronia]MCI1614346.1 TPM domain-containing protein [Heyndrickxia oleronia]MCI1745420.1 TPM domain-containing protein [Heyndrickxia oleronia]MCI1762227.1 TPM domain-containing protein [Heyndrickxia oleronia]
MSTIRMQKQGFLFLLMSLVLILSMGITAKAETFDRHKYIYDDAGLLTDQEESKLQELSSRLSEERDTAFMIITVNGTDGKDPEQYVEDFYDKNGPGYDQPFGNTAILFLDMQGRDIYLAGYKKAEDYLTKERLDLIRDEITPALSEGNYFEAFSDYITTSHEYMGEEPSSGSEEYNGYDSDADHQEYANEDTNVDSENILFQWWFQVIAALVVAGIVVAIMIYSSGGRVTVNGQTYINNKHSKVLSRSDRFVRQTVTKQKKPSNNTNNTSGGGGISRGGHSHSGSGGKF